MKALILTRGFAQQFDYNVIESIKPWGADLHSRVDELQRLTTSPSDYDFSFVLKGTRSEWSMILNGIPSKRRDFARSPLRTYLYLSGSAEEAKIASDILSLALADFCPRPGARYKGDDGALPHCLDAVATSDVVDGLVGWKGTEKIDAQKWSAEKLVPALRKAGEQAAQISLPGNCVGEFLDKAKALFGGSVGVLTGEYRSYLNNPEKDNPNFVFHFSGSDVRTFMQDGKVKRSPFDSRPAQVPPEPDPKSWGMPLKMAIAAVVVILVILGLRSCRSTTKKTVPTSAAPKTVTPKSEVSHTSSVPIKVTSTTKKPVPTSAAPTTVTPKNVVSNTPSATIKVTSPTQKTVPTAAASTIVTPESAVSNTPSATIKVTSPTQKTVPAAAAPTTLTPENVVSNTPSATTKEATPQPTS